MRRFSGPAELGTAVGERLGISAWHVVTQDTVNRFAEDTGDRQWIHVDPDRAGAGPFGAPVAHGYLVLALVPGLMVEVFEVGGVGVVLNKEVRRLRFQAPVRVGDRVRAAVDLLATRPRARGFWQADFRVTMQIDTVDDAAFTAETVFLYLPAQARQQ
ncbi:MAG TPA: MaoC family dehydratase [Pseudonocardiaceae bacterium]|jgi:acyl dehydratase